MSTSTVLPSTDESDSLFDQSFELLSDTVEASLKSNDQVKKDTSHTALFEPFATNWSTIVTKA